MASSQPAESPQNESQLRRALVALPILALSGVMCKAFTFGELVLPLVEDIYQTSVFDKNGLNVPILREFYGIKLLDESFGHITAAFCQLQFFVDERAYWQSLVFLTEFAGIYAILFFESFRPANSRTLFVYPFILASIAQLGGIGVFAPLYFYLLYILTPAEKLTSDNFRITSWSSSAAVLPTILFVYHVPHLSSYFHHSLEARNWWNWIWQLYPVWASALLFVLSTGFATLVGRDAEKVSQRAQLPTIRITVGVLVLINTVIWWYTVYNSSFSLLKVFIPDYFSEKPQDAAIALRTILQYDYLCTFGAVFLWLTLHFRDLQIEGICKLRYGRTMALVAVLSGLVGPGTVLLLAWLVREEILGAEDDDDEN